MRECLLGDILTSEGWELHPQMVLGASISGRAEACRLVTPAQNDNYPTLSLVPHTPDRPASLPHRYLSVLPSRRWIWICSPVSSFGCLVNKPFLCCKSRHLRVRACCESGKQAWFGDTKANLQVQAPWTFSSPSLNSGWFWLFLPFPQLPWAFLASTMTFSWSPAKAQELHNWGSGFRAQANITENLLYKAGAAQNGASVINTPGWDPNGSPSLNSEL